MEEGRILMCFGFPRCKNLIACMMVITLALFAGQETADAYFAKGLVLTSKKVSENGDIVGFIRNDYKYSYQNIVIGIDLYDKQKKKLTRVTGYPASAMLRPNSRSSFAVEIPVEWRGKFYSYKVVYILGTAFYEPKFL